MLDFPWETIRDRVGGVFNRKLWYAHAEAAALFGANNPRRSENREIFTLAAFINGELDAEKLLMTAEAVVSRFEQKASLFAHIDEKHLAVFMRRGFEIQAREPFFEWLR